MSASAGELHFRAFVAENNLVVAEERAGGHSFLAAEPENFGLGRHALGDFRIVGVEQRDVLFELIFKHTHFGAGVFLESYVAVEMIGREIQEHANFRAKGIDGFELKAADFGDGYAGVDRGFDQGQQRRADIAADQCGDVRGLQNVRDQRGGGGFAVRAGDGHEFAAQKAPGQLDFAPHRDAFGAGVFQRLDFRRDARADH